MTHEYHPPLGRSLGTTLVPKAGDGVRRLTVLGRAEGTAYARSVGRVTPMIERRLGPEVFANRAPGAGSLEPWRTARLRWRRSTARLLRVKAVATMDVSQCYDCMTPEVVGAVLRRCGVSHAAGLEVVRLLELFRAAGVSGIPIGPEPSAILANAVLAAVDEALRGRGVRFARWVDDFVIAAPSVKTLGMAELAAEAALADVGLSSNPGKHHRFDDPDAASAFVLRRGAEAGSTLEILAGR